MNHFKTSFVLLLLCCVPLIAQGKTWEICGECGTRTIAQGIAGAAPGDTLLIKKGVYREHDLVIDKPLALIGQDMPTIDGQGKGQILGIHSDGVSLDGLHLINVGTSYITDFAAVRVVQSKDFKIENLHVEKPFFAIYLERASDGLVANNKIVGDAVTEYNSGNGIQLWYSKNIKIIGNHVERVRDGIYLEFSDHIEILGNLSTKNIRYGLHFMFSDNNNYRENIFDDNGAGVAVMFSKHISMTQNIFRRNWGTTSFGLLLKEINDAKIVDNLFEDNSVGISVEGTNRVDFLDNDLTNNGWAIRVKGACYENRFSGNNFLYNSFDVSYNSKLNDNVFEGNHWSDYTGYDLDRNGIGDVPYRPVKLFSYIVNRSPVTMVLLRSLFMDIIDFSEKVSPVFTPDNLIDNKPLMKRTK